MKTILATLILMIATAVTAATAPGTKAITLLWAHPGAPTYKVYQQVNGSEWTLTKTVSSSDGQSFAPTEALLENLTPDTLYIFRVTAVNPAGESTPSETLSWSYQSVPQIPPAPTSLRVKAE